MSEIKYTCGLVAKPVFGVEDAYSLYWPDTSRGGVHMRRVGHNGQFKKADADLYAASADMLSALVEARDVLFYALENAAPGYDPATHSTILKMDAAIGKSKKGV